MDNYLNLTIPAEPSSLSPAEITREPEHLSTFEHDFYLVNGVVGSVLNTAVLLIALLHADTADKPRQIIVINMTLADLMTCTLYMLTRPYLNQFPALLCHPYYVVIVTSQLCSCLCLLWINVDKLIYIGRPLHYYQLVKRCRVILVMTLSWAAVLVLAIILYSFMEIEHPCDRVMLSAHIYLLICLLYVLTISASFAVSAVIYCIAQNSRRASTKAARSRLFKRLFFVFCSTAWTFATCLPYRLLYLAYALLITDAHQQSPPLIDLVINAMYYLVVIGIVLNPLITIVTQRLYRHWISVYWWRLIGRQKQHRASRDYTLVSSDIRRRSEMTTSNNGQSPPRSKISGRQSSVAI